MLRTGCEERVPMQPKRRREQAHRSPVAQLVEHRAVVREVISSTPAGPTLRVLK